jgi:23S rRNA U2552 (ribose-2'-O)-methylase RlmE/FtsJ
MFAEYDTDKNYHSYTDAYRDLYSDSRPVRRFDVRAVLELGIFRGGSLRAWRDFFPNAEIIGYDIDPGTMIRGEPRITTYCGDVRSTDGLREVAALHKYDLIVDDASHRPIDQFHALQMLWNSLVTGGFYVIEDLDMNRNGAEILTTSTLIVRGQAIVNLHLGDKRADDLLILEKT